MNRIEHAFAHDAPEGPPSSCVSPPNSVIIQAPGSNAVASTSGGGELLGTTSWRRSITVFGAGSIW